MTGRSAAAWLAAAATLTACAASRRSPEPIVSPTGLVYEIGTPPTETRLSQTATLYLRQDRPERALQLALEGIAAEPGNPVHDFLAGAAYARMGELTEAARHFSEAEQIYPAYELQTEPEREAAWGDAFNAGLEAYENGDVDGAIGLWFDATALYDLRPEAHRNLASVLAIEGRYDEAIETYRAGLAGLGKRPATRVLDPHEVEERAEAARRMEEDLSRMLLLTNRYAEAEPLLRRQLEREPGSIQLRGDLAGALAGQGRHAEAQALYSTLSEEGLAATQLFDLGVGLFRASDFRRAAEAFKKLTELRPRSRDAWFNYANSLFAAQDWASLASAGKRLVTLDPLGENAYLITARAQLEIGDEAAARRSLGLADSAPVHLDDLRLRRSGRETTVQGRVTANAASAGTPVPLRFVFLGDAGEELGVAALTVAAPTPGQSTSFDVSFAMRAAAYNYELLR
jgi:tetratricopeptide (TPR) repeat protein